jgi:hypothetical protein
VTPAERAGLIAQAKGKAIPFFAAVRSRNAHRVQVLSRDLGWEGVAALAVLLAEAADGQRLRVVVAEADDGMPVGVVRAAPRGERADAA